MLHGLPLTNNSVQRKNFLVEFPDIENTITQTISSFTYPENLHIEVYECYITQKALPMLVITSAIKKAVQSGTGREKLFKRKKKKRIRRNHGFF